jgi:hypothetical protein
MGIEYRSIRKAYDDREHGIEGDQGDQGALAAAIESRLTGGPIRSATHGLTQMREFSDSTAL